MTKCDQLDLERQGCRAAQVTMSRCLGDVAVQQNDDILLTIFPNPVATDDTPVTGGERADW